MTAAEVDAALDAWFADIPGSVWRDGGGLELKTREMMRAALTAARAAEPDPNATEVAARVLFMRYYLLRDDASEEWAEMYWRECANLPHKGDCPHAEHKGPITCDRCVCDEFRRDAAEVLAAVAAAREG